MTPPFDEGPRAGDSSAGDPHRSDDVPPRPFATPAFPSQAFPSESEWLDLQLPAADEFPLRSRETFADGVMQALRDEALLDAKLRAFDRDLPPELLQAWQAPEPVPGFVARTMAAARDDRRTHWQHLLARYVAPEPSPQFVARTLAALTAIPADGRTLGGASRWHRVAWPLLGAAAATLLWLLTSSAPPAPLELRVVRDTPLTFVQAYATSPLASVLAVREHAAEPDALVQGSADGVWLLGGEAR